MTHTHTKRIHCVFFERLICISCFVKFKIDLFENAIIILMLSVTWLFGHFFRTVICSVCFWWCFFLFGISVTLTSKHTVQNGYESKKRTQIRRGFNRKMKLNGNFFDRRKSCLTIKFFLHFWSLCVCTVAQSKPTIKQDVFNNFARSFSFTHTLSIPPYRLLVSELSLHTQPKN